MGYPLGREGHPGKEFIIEQIPELVVGDWPVPESSGEDGETTSSAQEDEASLRQRAAEMKKQAVQMFRSGDKKAAAQLNMQSKKLEAAAVAAAAGGGGGLPASETEAAGNGDEAGVGAAPAAASASVPAAAPVPAAVAAAFSTLTDQEKKDPLSVQLLFGEAVLSAELETAKAANDDLRVMMIEGAQSVLEMQVGSGQLSGPGYLQKVEERNAKDKILCRWLAQNGRKVEAARVLKRTKLMDTEIANMKAMFDGAEEGGEA